MHKPFPKTGGLLWSSAISTGGLRGAYEAHVGTWSQQHGVAHGDLNCLRWAKYGILRYLNNCIPYSRTSRRGEMAPQNIIIALATHPQDRR